ncbi:MAG: metal ABC transporter substrate-binding protein [Chloroflexi bacterium]|nr:metal ABC transporter substrate-binding protein [Chloroflexota bacterium]
MLGLDVRRLLAVCFASLLLFAAAACSDDAETDKFLVVTTVAPLRNIIEEVGGDRISVIALVPEGTNSHTFDPPPSAVGHIERAQLIVINGLNLELPTLELAEANASDDTPIVLLGDLAVSPDEYVFDFSFPEEGGNPNPHLWTAPDQAVKYVEIVQSELSKVDPDGEEYYRANAERLIERLWELDEAIAAATQTIPEAHRKLITYHDSFPYFAPRYGLEVIGAVQPSDFSEPSPREVADLIAQVRAAGVPAIFGSEVFPSEVLDTIAAEAGAVQVSTLSDDDLPGEPGDVENTLVAMMVENVRTMVTALGGDASALDGFDVGSTWRPSE